VTDVTLSEEGERGSGRLFERAYSSREAPPAEMAQAVLASAAISALVLPLQVGDRIGTDGGWVRNYPLGYAFERPEVELVVGFRYEARYPQVRLGRYARLPAARALVAEIREAVEREQRGQPAHIVDLFSRLTRVAIIRNTALEELVADWRDESVAELQALRSDVLALVEDEELARRIDGRFARARFPFRHDRRVPRITVAAAADEVSLEPGFRNPKPWDSNAKRELIARGYALTDEALREYRPSTRVSF
jgi:predicted acylesterase/phospholipase RssA